MPGLKVEREREKKKKTKTTTNLSTESNHGPLTLRDIIS